MTSVFCVDCGILKLESLSLRCSVCESVRDSIEAQPGLVRAHRDWARENIRLAKLKAKILGQDVRKDAQ